MRRHADDYSTNQSLVLRPKKAAKELGVSIATFWRLVKAGHIETVKLGKRATGVRRAELERFAENGIDE